jgi:glycosyltransferase involved in cell wall biosynthesis
MLAEKLREFGFEVDLMNPPKIPIKNFKNPSFIITSMLSGFLKKKYDIVHAFNVPSAFAMKSVRAKKRVLSIHGIFSDQINAIHSSMLGKIAGFTEERVLKWADKLTTDSKASKEIYKKKLGLDFVYLPSPIDTSKFHDLPKVDKIENQITYIGRDSHEKGIDLLRKIEKKLNGKVVYCTNVSWMEAMTTLKSSSVVVVPSRIESLPTVVKEAFYLKIPVVATNVGGTSELVTDKITGTLVPSDDPEKLLEEINNLLKNKEHAEKLANAAYDFVVKNMTWEVVLPKYVNFYENLLKS